MISHKELKSCSSKPVSWLLNVNTLLWDMITSNTVTLERVQYLNKWWKVELNAVSEYHLSPQNRVFISVSILIL
jgi:hypothetical protein